MVYQLINGDYLNAINDWYKDKTRGLLPALERQAAVVLYQIQKMKESVNIVNYSP